MTIVLAWWSAMLVIGIAVLPLTQLIFRKFEDKGWLFSKTLGLFITAWALWAANCTGVLTFTQRNAFLVIGVIAAVNYGAAAVVIHRRGAATLPAAFSADEKHKKAPDRSVRGLFCARAEKRVSCRFRAGWVCRIRG